MKKLIIAIIATLFSLQSFAQFEEGKSYISTSLSGLNLNYSSGNSWKFSLDATAGHFFWEDVMLVGRLGYNHEGNNDNVYIGIGSRYYIIQNGLHIGANAQFAHSWAGNNNFQVGPEIGYTFFLNKHVTVEPAIYYNMSLNDFSNGSEAGLRIGFGFIF